MTAAYDATSTLSFTTSNSWTHTPTGTARGVLVLLASNGLNDTYTAVTYGGVAMTQVGTPAQDAAGETGQVAAYFLGASIPTGAQTISVTVSAGTPDETRAWGVSITSAGGDTQVAANNKTSGDLTNPSVTLGTAGGFAGFVAGVLFSGVNAPASIAAGSGYTLLSPTHDYGSQSAAAQRSDSRSGASVACGFTVGLDDAALIGVAVEEIAPTTLPPRPFVVDTAVAGAAGD